MKGTTWKELRQSIERGAADPVYVFTGTLPEAGGRGRSEWAESRSRPEAYLQREALRLIKERWVDAAFRDFNYLELSAVQHSLDAIALAAAQLPAFASRRVVLVRDLDRRFKPKRSEHDRSLESVSGFDAREEPLVLTDSDAPADTAPEALIEYLRRPSDSTTLIFIWDRPDRKLRLATALFESATIVEFPRLRDEEAGRWAREYVKQGNCSIEPPALTELLGRVGTDLTLLSNELDKLINKVGGGPIRLADVEALTTRLREHFSFEFLDQIAAKRTDRALRLMRRRLNEGIEPLPMLGSIAAYYRRAIVAKEMLVAGSPPEEVVAAARISAFKGSQYLQQLRKTPMEELTAAMRRIAEVDDAIKSSRATPALQLEMLVYQLCNSAFLH